MEPGGIEPPTSCANPALPSEQRRPVGLALRFVMLILDLRPSNGSKPPARSGGHEQRLNACGSLEAPQDHVDVQGINLHAPAGPARLLAGHEGRSGTEEGVQHDRLPAVVGNIEIAREGALFAYDIDRADLWRRAALYIDRILRGVSPGELPIEQPTRFNLLLNLNTAKALRREAA